MGIIQIRDYQPKVVGYGVRHDSPAVVIILPMVKIERHPHDVVESHLIARRLRHRSARKSLLTLRQKMDALRELKAKECGD